MSKEWPEERVAELKQLNDAGLSAGRIALQMGGVTRNAIIGKLARLGLKSLNGSRGQRLTAEQCQARRDAFNARRREQRAGIAHPPKPAHRPWEGPEITELPLEKSACAVPFMALEPYHCRYQVSNEPRLFCGVPRVDDKHSYCLWHCRVCFVDGRGNRTNHPRSKFSAEAA